MIFERLGLAAGLGEPSLHLPVSAASALPLTIGDLMANHQFETNTKLSASEGYQIHCFTGVNVKAEAEI